MARRKCFLSRSGLLTAVLLWLMLPVAGSMAAPIANIDIIGVTPNDVSTKVNSLFDEVSAGLHNVAVGTKAYFRAEPVAGQTVGGYQWAITSAPAGSLVSFIGSPTSDTVALQPDKVGFYTISLTPLDATQKPTESVTTNLTVANWVGVGTIDTHETPHPVAPQCGTAFCHGGSNADPDLNVLPEWQKTHHAQVLEFHLNGSDGSHYAVSCMECHTLGFNQAPAANNGGFDDAAASIGYNLNQIPDLVAQAAATGVDQFPQLPAALQAKANIQCENCHGPGALHPSHLSDADHGISGVNLDTKQCAQCHDEPPHHFYYQQWKSMGHSESATLLNGEVAENSACIKCHTGEGFVGVRADNRDPNDVLAEMEASGRPANSITCSTCHDPHGGPNIHQLRVVGDFTLDSGQTFSNPGMGGLCMRCHNSRVADVNKTLATNFRGSHHGPQADMLLGVNGAEFNLPVAKISPHYKVVPDTCVHCHMAAGVTNTAMPVSLVGGHTFAMSADTATTTVDNVANTCGTCHTGLDTFDRPARGDYDGNGKVEGIQTEVQGLFNLLQPGILANMKGTSVSSAGTISISATDYANLTPDQKAALYDFNFVWQDGSFGVHNASYAVQMLQRAYYGVYGRPISQDYPQIMLRGEVQAQNAARVWSLYE